MPLFDPLLIPKRGISRGFGAKRPQTASKRARNACLSTPDGPGSALKKHVVGHALTPSRSQNGPFEGLFGGQQSLQTVQNVVKTARDVSLIAPNGLASWWATLNLGRFQTHSGAIWAHLEVFQGQITHTHTHTPFTGEEPANHDQKAACTSPKWIPYQDTATGRVVEHAPGPSGP